MTIHTIVAIAVGFVLPLLSVLSAARVASKMSREDAEPWVLLFISAAICAFVTYTLPTMYYVWHWWFGWLWSTPVPPP